MDLQKLFDSHFGPCILTNHALIRFSERLVASDYTRLDLLLTNALRGRNLDKLPLDFAIVEARYSFVIVCHKELNQAVKVVTFVRGKESIHDCEIIHGNINQEKHLAEVAMLRDYAKKTTDLKRQVV